MEPSIFLAAEAEQERGVLRQASELAPLVLPEQVQVQVQARVQVLPPELLQEPVPETPRGLLEPPAQRQVGWLADWQVVVPSSHLTLALSSCIHSSPGRQTGRGSLQKALISRT
jgi:hypothetical protein